MAGGYKLWSTGEVVTATNLQNYIQNQTVMVFASASARTTALSGVLAEGMISYRTDSHVLEIYNGTAWVAATPLTTKGDLATFDTAAARLPVGSDGQTLVANSSASTGLSWANPLQAGKNKIINGDFGVWQRGTSITLTNGVGVYGADRFSAQVNFSAGTSTITQQAFTPGTAPVSGYESAYFQRLTCGSTASFAAMLQRIEDVRTFAGQTVTFSFWAKSSSATTFTIYCEQNFGSGGSATVVPTVNTPTANLTTSWQRFTTTITLPSLSGKTLGTGHFLLMDIYSSTTLNGISIDTWGWQVEAGSVATAFQTATGTVQGELAACQRYYYRNTAGVAYAFLCPTGMATATTTVVFIAQFPVIMRVAPTSLDFGGSLAVNNLGSGAYLAGSSLSLAFTSPSMTGISANATGLTTGTVYDLRSNNDAAAYIGFSAEL
jgi:hypothetical protein